MSHKSACCQQQHSMSSGQHTLFVARGDFNSDKALNLLDLLTHLRSHVQIIDVKHDDVQLPPWIDGVPIFYNNRLQCPARGSHGLEQMIDEDEHIATHGMYASKTAPPPSIVTMRSSQTHGATHGGAPREMIGPPPLSGGPAPTGGRLPSAPGSRAGAAHGGSTGIPTPSPGYSPSMPTLKGTPGFGSGAVKGKKGNAFEGADWAQKFMDGVDMSDEKAVERARDAALQEAIRRRDAMGDPFGTVES